MHYMPNTETQRLKKKKKKKHYPTVADQSRQQTELTTTNIL